MLGGYLAPHITMFLCHSEYCQSAFVGSNADSVWTAINYDVSFKSGFGWAIHKRITRACKHSYGPSRAVEPYLSPELSSIGHTFRIFFTLQIFFFFF